MINDLVRNLPRAPGRRAFLVLLALLVLMLCMAFACGLLFPPAPVLPAATTATAEAPSATPVPPTATTAPTAAPPTAAPTQTSVPTTPPTATLIVPTETPLPPTPTPLPPTATRVPPTPTTIPPTATRVPSPTPRPTPVIGFSVSPNPIDRGDCSTLDWDVDNVQTVSIYGGEFGSAPGRGVVGHDTRRVCPPGTTAYTLVARTASDTRERRVTLTVRQPNVLIDFENLTTTGWGTGGQQVVRSQYAGLGVTFNDVVALDFSKGIAIPGFAHSGTRAIEQCYAAEFCTAPIRMTFSQAARKVSYWVGYSSSLSAATTIENRAWRAALSVTRLPEDSETFQFPQSTGPQPIRRQVILSASSSLIGSVEIEFAASLGGGSSGIAVDDVEIWW